MTPATPADREGPLASVLVVDDQPGELLVLEAVLAPLGVDVLRARSGAEALRAAREIQLAAVLLDVRMPGMDGLETAARLRSREPNRSVPILFVSAGDADAGYVRRYYRAGAVDYVTKPYDPEIVRAKVGVLVELWRRGERLRRREAEVRAREHALAVQREREARASADTRAAILDTLVQTAPIGIAFFDRALRFQTVNDTLARMHRVPREAHLGRTIAEALPTPLISDLAERVVHVIETGESVMDLDCEWDDDGRPAHAVVSFFPVRDGGAIAGAGMMVVDVTDRRAAQAEAEAQRGLLEAVFAQAPVAIAAWRGPEHRFELASPSYLQMVNLGPGVIGRTLREVLSEQELSGGGGIAEVFDRVYATGETYLASEHESLWDRGGDGTLAPGIFSFTISPRRDHDGAVIGLIAVAVEVTEEVRSRREIERLATVARESEARYRDLFETAAVSLWDQDLTGCLRVAGRLQSEGVTDFRAHLRAHPELVRQAIASVRTNGVNAQSRQLLGARTEDEMLGSLERLIAPETHETFVEALATIAEGGTSFVDEAVIRTLKGERREVLCSIRFPEEQARFDRVPVSLTDITARKRSERTLALLAKTGEILAESLDVRDTLQKVTRLAVPAIADWMSVSLCDHDGRLELVAVAHEDPAREPLVRRAFELSRANAEQALGEGRVRLVREVTDAERESVAVDASHRALIEALDPRSYIWAPLQDERGPFGVITMVLAGAGRRFDDEALALVEELARRVSVGIDRARLLAAAQRERERAEAANRAKDLFLSTLSHELRNPLNAILGWTQMMRMGDLPADRVARAIEVIDRNAQSQAALIEDILDLSRITSGKLRLEVVDVDLAHVVEAALETVRAAADAKGIRLEVALDKTIGPMRGDATRLQQVVWNLLSNAVKFTPPGGTITVRLRRLAERAAIAVTDTGAGIAPEFVGHVFDTFRQEDASSTRRQGGLGLGLGIAKHIAELHGGTIRAESAGLGHGACFTVELPIAARHSATPPPRPAISPRALGPALSCPPELRGLSILVVDDEPDAREMLTTLLARCDAVVSTATSASEALDALSTRSVDLLLADIGMPGEDGYALIRRVRALPGGDARIPAVALTAYASRADRTRALAEGFSTHVAKPVDFQELAVVLASLVAR